MKCNETISQNIHIPQYSKIEFIKSFCLFLFPIGQGLIQYGTYTNACLYMDRWMDGWMDGVYDVFVVFRHGTA